MQPEDKVKHLSDKVCLYISVLYVWFILRMLI